MTLMLRTQGIPARIVNGFQMGEYSELSDFYTVRQSDAHSWVEVYFPKYGWIAFDPTPSAGLNQYENNWLATVRHVGESLEMFWLESVIGFGANEQASLVFRLHRTFSGYQSDVSTTMTEWRLQFAGFLKTMRELLPPLTAMPWYEMPSGVRKYESGCCTDNVRAVSRSVTRKQLARRGSKLRARSASPLVSRR